MLACHETSARNRKDAAIAEIARTYLESNVAVSHGDDLAAAEEVTESETLTTIH